jgi:F5/8 type C domain-containing protein
VTRGGWLLVFAGVGALVRIALLRAPEIWYDEATTGLMALAVLRGDFPLYFVGQPFMGALDAYLAAPLFLLFGVSVRVLKLVPLGLTLVWTALTVRVAWQGFGPRAAAFTAGLLAIPPDYLLSWSLEARTHYQLSCVLGTLALLLAYQVLAAPRRHALLRLGVLGGVLGLAFWTNFLSLVFFPPMAILVLRRGPRPLVPSLAVAAAGFTAGSLPHWLYGLRHGTALPPPGEWIGLARTVRNLGIMGRVPWPIFAGVPEPLRERGVGVLLAVALAIVYGLAFAMAGRAVRRSSPAARPLGLALATLVVVTVGLTVGTQYGARLDDDPRYLLPLYTALPPLLGAGLAHLGAPGAILTTGVLVVQGLGAAAGTLHALAPAAVTHLDAERQAERQTVATLERDGPARLYAHSPGVQVLAFLSRERVVFSDPAAESYPPYARAVDGADAVGWWLPLRPPGLGPSLEALGARFTVREIGGVGVAFVDFALPPERLRELDPGTLTATAHPSATRATSMLDREAETFWSTDHAMRGGEWFQVDLGRVEPVALIRWLPFMYQDMPVGLTVDASLDGATWRRLLALPEYHGPLYWSAGHPVGRVRGGRVELRVPPTPARYLRVTQTGTQAGAWHWTVRELFLYAAEPSATPVPASADGAALARAIRATGVTRLYADAGWGSRIALADPTVRVPTANLTLDAYDFRGPGPELLPAMDWRPGSGALVEAPEVDGFLRVARASGLGWSRLDLGGLTLFVYAAPAWALGTPMPASALRASAWPNSRRADRAVDGKPTSRWTTGRRQAPGDWLRVDFAGPRAVRAVHLSTGTPTDWPRGLQLEGSADGETWRTLPTETWSESAVHWGGLTLLRGDVRGLGLVFPPVTLRALRLSLTHGHPEHAWSVDELTVYAAEPPP